MRVAELATLTVRQPVRHGSLAFKFGDVRVVESVVVQVVAENGEMGFGVIEATSPLGLPAEAVLPILRLFRDAIVGAEVRHHRHVLTNARQRLFSLNYSFNPILAAIDGALHDLAARLYGLSLCEYIGGPSDGGNVRTLDIIPLCSDEHTEKLVQLSVGNGIDTVKLKLTGDRQADIARVKYVREKFGPSLGIYCDANGAYGLQDAQNVAAVLAELRADIFEQPVIGSDLEGMAALARDSLMDIEADESVCSAREVAAVMHAKAANVISLRISRFGSIEETLRIAQTCAENGFAFRFGAMFAPCLQNAITAHVALALPQQSLAHELSMHGHFLDDPFEGYELIDGKVRIDPDRPGTGLTLRADHSTFTLVGP